MKKLILMLFTFCAFCSVYGQKTAQEYFNVSARLYAEKQQDAALYTVSRGCELFEKDSSLAQLKRLIEGENNQQNQQQKQNKNDKNQNNQDQQNQDGQGQSQDGQQNNQQNQQGNQESQQKGDQQQNNDKQEQGQESQMQQGQQDNNQPNEDKKGQISKVQAEMMLDAIDQNDKAVQQRLMLQKQQKKNNNRIEKNW